MARLGDTQDRPLWVKLSEGSITLEGDVQVDFGDLADLDTGAGVDEHPVFAIGMAGPGGHVVWDGSVQTGLEDELAALLTQLEAIADVLVDVWDDLANALRVQIQGTVPVSQSGPWTVATSLEDDLALLAKEATLQQVLTAAEAAADVLVDAWDDVGNRLRVDVTASVLPAGAATEATLATRASSANQLLQLTELEAIADVLVDAWSDVDNALRVVQQGTWTVQAVQSGTWTVQQGGSWTVATGLDDELQAIRDVLVDAWDDLNNAVRVRAVVTSTVNGPTPQNGATTAPTVSTPASTILAASATRRGALLQNDGLGIARVALGGTTPTASLGHRLLPGDALPIAGGVAVKAIREGATDTTLQVSEVTD